MAGKFHPQFSVDFSGCAAIVTGAGAGVGKAAALALAQAGAAVVVNDLNPDRADTVAEAIQAAGGQALAWQADVANRFQVGSLIEAGRDAFGDLHILINAAGVFKAGSAALLDEWDWRRVLDVNLTGAFFCTQLFARVIADQGTGGAVVNVASPVGLAGSLSEGISYAASKAGVIGLTRQSAREYAPFQLRVNALCPAHIRADEPSYQQNWLARPGDAEEAAAVALFLCSGAASFITGQAIIVDGGDAR